MAKFTMSGDMLKLVRKESALSSDEFITLGSYLVDWCDNYPDIKQPEISKVLNIPLRKFKRLLSIGRWPEKVKNYVILRSEKFSQTSLERFVDQKWIGKRRAIGKNGRQLKRKVSYFKTQALLNAVERHADQVKIPIRIHKPKHLPSANIRYVEDAIRSKLMIKTEILEDSKTILIPCGNWEQLDRVYREICH